MQLIITRTWNIQVIVPKIYNRYELKLTNKNEFESISFYSKV